LYLRYRPSCLWFDVAAMARKNALAAAAIFFSQNAVVASVLSVAVLAYSIHIQRKYHPYHPGDHRFAEVERDEQQVTRAH